MKTIFGIIALAAFIGIGVYVYIQMPASAPVLGQPTATAEYACNEGKSITASFYQGESTPAASADQPPTPGGSAKVSLSDGREMTLAQTISADGARYANADESFVFWSKGNGALVLENNVEKSYIGCITLAQDPGGLPQGYSSGSEGFSIRLPSLQASTTNNGDTYKLDESYVYQALGPGHDIYGIKFGIPPNVANGTNLSSDSYISVEQIPNAQTCSAAMFIEPGTKVKTLADGDTSYSFASTTGAGAGNRYEEWVYALPGTNPCMAVRYFIHYGVFENYPAGTVKEFDQQALLNQFDSIRRTLVVNQ